MLDVTVNDTMDPISEDMQDVTVNDTMAPIVKICRMLQLMILWPL